LLLFFWFFIVAIEDIDAIEAIGAIEAIETIGTIEAIETIAIPPLTLY